MNIDLRFAVRDWSLPAVVFVLVFTLWEAVCRTGLVAPYILPAPSAIAVELVKNRATLTHHGLVTMVEIVLGFFAAVLTGVLLAMAVIFIKPFERAFYPWIVATQAIPKVALGPLFVVWFGFGLLPKVLIACLIAFFPVMVGTIIGLRSIQPESLFLMRSMGAGPLKTFWYARLPNGLPSIFGGLKVAVILASVGAIVGEFIGTNEGLGYVLVVANGMLDITLLFAALVVISVLTTILYLAVHVLEATCIGWHVSHREKLVPST